MHDLNTKPMRVSLFHDVLRDILGRATAHGSAGSLREPNCHLRDRGDSHSERRFRMPDRVRKVKYIYARVPHRAGQGAMILGELRKEGINLLGFSGFPLKAGKSQLDMITEDLAPVRRIAKKTGLRLSKPKKGFLIQGKDEIGAVHRHVQKLATERINITAADAVCAGKGRYGMILWVKPGQYTRAARILKAK
jgi:hypothetical protein